MQPATPAHAAVLALIHASAFAPASRWGAEAMALQLSLPGAFGHVDPGGGFVLARVVLDEAEILTLAVVPERRRQGLGAGLLRRAMRTAAARGAASMVLEVAADNAAARALYARHGFEHVGRRRRYYPGGADALILRAPLSPPCGSEPG